MMFKKPLYHSTWLPEDIPGRTNISGNLVLETKNYGIEEDRDQVRIARFECFPHS